MRLDALVLQQLLLAEANEALVAVVGDIFKQILEERLTWRKAAQAICHQLPGPFQTGDVLILPSLIAELAEYLVSQDLIAEAFLDDVIR